MDAEETKSAAAVMIAWAEGKPIEIKKPDREDWRPILSPSWDWINHDYRIAPEPVEVEVWVHESGAMRERSFFSKNTHALDAGWTLRRATIHSETK